MAGERGWLDPKRLNAPDRETAHKTLTTFPERLIAHPHLHGASGPSRGFETRGL